MGFLKTVSDKFNEKSIRLFSSWCWIKNDFEDDFEVLQKQGCLVKNAPGTVCIWKTKQKYVLKLAAPSGRNIACKKYHKFRNPQHFLNRPTPAGLEALNYQEILSMGIPAAKVLAAGEKRFLFFPIEAFFITEFLEGTCDGREFIIGGKYIDKAEWKKEFIKKNIQYIAKFHDKGFHHKGFTPFNMLWKEKEAPMQKEGDRLDIFWIDVASCRKIKEQEKLLPGKAEDFGHFFSFFELTEEERKEYIRFYMENAHALASSFEEFFPMVEECYTIRMKKRKY